MWKAGRFVLRTARVGITLRASHCASVNFASLRKFELRASHFVRANYATLRVGGSWFGTRRLLPPDLSDLWR